MASVNKVLLSGNLGATPALEYTPKGTPAVELRLAVNRRQKDGEAWVDKTDWHSVQLYGKTAENAARYLVKGSGVFIEGELRVDTWVDAETQKNRSKTKVWCDRLHFLPSGKPATRDATVVPITPPVPVMAVEEEPPF